MRQKLSIAFVCLAVIPLVLMTALILQTTERALVNSAFERSSRLAAVLSDDLNALLMEKTRMLKIAVANSDIRSMDADRQTAVLKDLIDKHSDLYAAVVVDANGGLLARFDGKREGGDYNDRDYYKTALKTGDTVFSDVLVSKTTGKPGIMIAEPIKNADQTIRGVIVVALDLQKLTEVIGQAQIGTTGYSYIVNSEGKILIHPDSELAATAMDVSELAAVRAAISGQTGWAEYELNNKKILAGYSYVPITKWGLVVRQPLDEALAETADVKKTGIGIMLIAAAIAALLGLIAARSLAEPIAAITAEASRLAAGDLSVKLNIPASDEIGQLAVAFNNMTAQVKIREMGLRDSEEKYRQLHEELMATHEELTATHEELLASQEELRQQFDHLSVKEKEVDRQNAVLTMLHKTVLNMLCRLDREEVLKMIISGATELVGSSHGFINLVNERKGVFERAIGVGYYEQDVGNEYPLTEGLVGKVYESGEIGIINDYAAWEHRIRGPFFDQLRSIAQVPLKAGDKVIGIFGLAFLTTDRKFSANDTALLQRFADLAAIALDNAMLIAAYKDELQERKEMEEALRLSEEKFSKIFHMSPDVIVISRMDGTIVEVNEGFTQKTGYSKAEALGKAWHELEIWEDLQDRERMVEALKSNGELDDLEASFRGRGGIVGDGLISARIIKVDGENCILSFTRDITERKLSEKLQTALYQISETTGSAASLAELCRVTHEIVGELVPAENFYIALYDDQEQMLHFPYRVEDYGTPASSRQFKNSLTEYVIRTGEPLRADAAAIADLELQGKVVLLGPSPHDWLGLPLKTADGRVIGVMTLKTYDDKVKYTEKHTEILSIVAQQVSIAIERKQAEEKLKFLSSRDTLTGVYNRGHFEEILVSLKDSGSKPIALIICDINGMKLINDTMGHEAGDQLLKAATANIQKAVRTGDIVARIGGDEFGIILPRSDEQAAEAICERIRSRIAAYNRKVGGVRLSMSFGYAVQTEKTASIEELFKEADDHMYREKLHHMQSVRSHMVQTAMKLLEARDFITEGHANRLQELAVGLARKIGLSGKRIADIRLLGQFHDIGKVGIPDHILLKPGKLTPEEKKEMQRHSEIGYRIAQVSTELSPIADWVLKHHEWWDGRGYPLGLKGEDIPLECRILAIVDAYDAMTSDRPYRKALGKEAAIEELNLCAGAQFDPELVQCFISELKNEEEELTGGAKLA